MSGGDAMRSMKMKVIEEFPDYTISEYGIVYKDGVVIKMNPNSGNRPSVRLTKDGRRYRRSIHRLLALAFIPNNRGIPTDKLEVNHIDGNKYNNSLDNLEWVTKEENMQHAKENKLFYRGRYVE